MLVRMILCPGRVLNQTATSFKSQFHALATSSLLTWHNTHPDMIQHRISSYFRNVRVDMNETCHCDVRARIGVLWSEYRFGWSVGVVHSECLYTCSELSCMITMFICIINAPTGKTSQIDLSNLNLIWQWSHPAKKLYFATHFGNMTITTPIITTISRHPTKYIMPPHVMSSQVVHS